MALRIALVAGVLAVAVAAAGAGTLLWRGQAAPDAPLGDIKKYVVIQSLEAPTLTFVDILDDELAGRVDLPTQPDQVLVSAGIDRVLYSRKADRTLTIYDQRTRAVEATIDLGLTPDRVEISPDGLVAAVADGDAGRLAIVSLEAREVVATADGLDRPTALSFSSDSLNVYVADGAGGRIRVFDANSGFELDAVPVSLAGSPLSAVTRTPNGLYGAVVDAAAGRMSLVDFRQWKEVESIRLGKAPSRPYITADGQYMMVPNGGDGTVSVLSTQYFDVEATLPAAGPVTSISSGYFETLVYVVSHEAEKASVIDLSSMTVVGDVDLAGGPGPAVVEAGGLKMYVALTDEDALLVVDVVGRTISKRIEGVGPRPWGLSMALSNNYCH